MGGKFTVFLITGKYYIVIHVYSSQHWASVMASDNFDAGMGAC
jgi:hypothetical protein